MGRDTDRTSTLLGLLDDASPTVWRAVRRELRGMGREALPLLRRASSSGHPRARARARRMLLDRSRDRTARRLTGYVARGATDLERAMLLLSRIEEPELDARPYLLALDALAAEVQRRSEPLPPGSPRARVLVDYLGRELGYGGDEGDYHHPDNVYLHRAITRKRGLPLTLAAIYLFVARRAGLPAALVGLPGHVVLRLHGPDRNLLIDPFNGGAELTERECLAYLAERGLPFQSAWFADASDDRMFERQVRNLCVSYRRRELKREVRLLARVLLAMQSRGEVPVEAVR